MNNNDKNFKLTEPIILTLEKEKEDTHLLKKYRFFKNIKKTYGRWFFRIIFIIIFLYSSYYFINLYIYNKKNDKIIEMVNSFVETTDNHSNNQSNDNSEQISEKKLKIDFDKLYEINNSCFGWININNTNISYPIVKYTNNEYYLNHSFDHSYNSSGWIFADYRNACDGFDKNLIIYGHNVKNGTMFNPLNNCLNKEWYENDENKIITIYTPTEEINYEIFSIYSIKVENYYTTTSFLSNNVFETFLNTLKSRSKFKSNVELNSTDKILTLSTCSERNTSRTVIHAKKISN